LRTNFMGYGGRPPMAVGVRKLESSGYHFGTGSGILLLGICDVTDVSLHQCPSLAFGDYRRPGSQHNVLLQSIYYLQTIITILSYVITSIRNNFNIHTKKQTLTCQQMIQLLPVFRTVSGLSTIVRDQNHILKIRTWHDK